MADCNSIESLLNELLGRLDTGDGTPYDTLAQLIFALSIRVDNLERINLLQQPKLDATYRDIGKLKAAGNLLSRLIRAEQQIKAQIGFTARLDTRVKKLQNDFNFAVKRFTTRLNTADKKNVDQDGKITTIDEQLSIIKAALLALTGAGGALAVFTAKLAALVAKQKLLEGALDSLKRIAPQRGQKGDKGDKGDPGKNGSKGDTGQKGDTGLRGEKGLKGDAGNKGNKGDTGQKGDTGLRGEKGLKGDRGERGRNGIDGVDGTNGVDGVDGTNGVDGVDGTNGVDGVDGQQGIQGEKGEVGEVTVIEVEKTVLVYEQPDFTEVFEKILELRNVLIYNSSVAVASSCDTSQTVETTNLPSFLNAIEDKLTQIEKLICDKESLVEYDLGTFTNTKTVVLDVATRFVKLEVLEVPGGIGKRFSRVPGEPDNYEFGSVAFTSPYGLKPEIEWKWINSYFTPQEDDMPTKFHVYPAYLDITYKLTGYKVEQ